jgi:hypothetical protein
MSIFASTYSGRFARDSVGVFLENELARQDFTLYEPLVSMTWSRDIPLRSDVSVGNEFSAFFRLNFGAVGGTQSNGLALINDSSTAIPSANVDTQRVVFPLKPWGMSVQYTMVELAQSMELKRPIDTQKIASLNLKHEMDTNHIAYLGDQTTDAFGLLNSPESLVTQATTPFAQLATQGESGAEAIQAALYQAQSAIWRQTGYAACPDTLLLPPETYSLLNRTVSQAGTFSLLEYVSRFNPFTKQTNKLLDIQPVKFLDNTTGTDWLGNGNKNRAVFYTRNERFVRFPKTPLQRATPTYQDLWYRVSYWCKMGHIEVVYPEALGYLDGI